MNQDFEDLTREDQLLFALQWYRNHVGNYEGIDFLGNCVSDDERWIADFIIEVTT